MKANEIARDLSKQRDLTYSQRRAFARRLHAKAVELLTVDCADRRALDAKAVVTRIDRYIPSARRGMLMAAALQLVKVEADLRYAGRLPR